LNIADVIFCQGTLFLLQKAKLSEEWNKNDWFSFETRIFVLFLIIPS